MKTFHFRIPVELHKKIQKTALEDCRSMNSLITKAVIEYLYRSENEKQNGKK